MRIYLAATIVLAIILSACSGKKAPIETDSEEVEITKSTPDSPQVEIEEPEEEKEPQHLTQYIMVQSDEIIATFRDNAGILKNMGFKVKNFKTPATGGAYTEMTATRQGKDGVTTIKKRYLDDAYVTTTVTIDFANKSELDSFVESMKASKWVKQGDFWTHPTSKDRVGWLMDAKINGLTVTLTNRKSWLGPQLDDDDDDDI